MWLSIGLRYWRQILILFLFLSFIPFIFICSILGGYEQQQQSSSFCGAPTTLTGNGNEDQIYNFLISQLNMNPSSASGMMANFEQESGFSPTAINDVSGAYGIGQWLGSRLTALKQYAQQNNSSIDQLTVQLGYLKQEMNSGDYGSIAAMNLLNPVQASSYFEENFEKAGSGALLDKRAGYAISIFNKYSGTTVAATPTLTSVCSQPVDSTVVGTLPPSATDPEPWYLNVMSVALKFKGMPYFWGGDAPVPGFDCSGLWEYSFGQIGIRIPRTAQQQYDFTERVSQDQLKPGDFIFFKGTYNGPYITHVGLYVGNGYMYDSDNAGIGYHELNSYWQKHIAGYGRLK